VDSGLERVSDLPPFASASTRDLLDFGLQSVIQRQRLIEVIVRTFDACAGRPLRDGYLVDLLTQSLEGAVVQVCSAGKWIDKLLKQIRAGRLRDFARPRRGRDKITPEQRALLADGREAFRYLFPQAVVRQSGRPNAADVKLVEDAVRSVLKPLLTHRDRIVAHWDPESQRRATWGDLVNAVRVLVELLSRLWFIHTGTVYQVPTLSPHSRESTSALLAEAVQR
jgi:hypothetical protein